MLEQFRGRRASSQQSGALLIGSYGLHRGFGHSPIGSAYIEAEQGQCALDLLDQYRVSRLWHRCRRLLALAHHLGALTLKAKALFLHALLTFVLLALIVFAATTFFATTGTHLRGTTDATNNGTGLGAIVTSEDATDYRAPDCAAQYARTRWRDAINNKDRACQHACNGHGTSTCYYSSS